MTQILARVLLLAGALTCVPLAEAQSVVGTITRPGFDPRSLAVYEALDRVFVSDASTGTLYMFDGTTLQELGSVQLGGLIRALVVDEQSAKLYAGGAPNDSVQRLAVVDAASAGLIRYLSGDGRGDYANLFQGMLAADPGLRKVYALHLGGLTQIDIATDAETEIPGYGGGQFEWMGVQPLTHEVFVTRYIDNVLGVVDGQTLQQETIPGLGGAGLGINWLENKVYVARGGGVGVPFKVYDRDSGEVADVFADNDALRWAFNPASNRIYTDAEVNRISTVIDGSTDSFTNVEVGSGAIAVAVRPATGHVYYASKDFIAIYDESSTRLTKIPVGEPLGGGVVVADIAINQTTGRVFVLNHPSRGFITVLQDEPTLTSTPTPTGSPAASTPTPSRTPNALSLSLESGNATELTLLWSGSQDSDFTRYEVYRAAANALDSSSSAAGRRALVLFLLVLGGSTLVPRRRQALQWAALALLAGLPLLIPGSSTKSFAGASCEPLPAFEPIATLELPEQPRYRDTGLTPGQEFVYLVRGVNASGQCTDSHRLFARAGDPSVPTPTLPAQPTATPTLAGAATATPTVPPSVPADGTYEGATEQGRSISVTVSGGKIVEWSFDYVCPQFSSSAQVQTSCPVASSSFSCGTTFCAPFAASSRIQGSFAGSGGVSGTFDVRHQPDSAASCCQLTNLSWSAALQPAERSCGPRSASGASGSPGSKECTAPDRLSGH